MNKYMQSAKKQWKDAITLIMAVALFISPWALGYTDTQAAFWNAIVIGAIMAVGALSVLVKFHEWEEWGMLAMGGWLLAAPTLLGYMTLVAAAWTHILVGFVAIGMTAWAIWDAHHHPMPGH